MVNQAKPHVLELDRGVIARGELIGDCEIIGRIAPELEARLHKCIDFLKTLTPAQIAGSEEKAVTLTAGKNTFNFKELDYLNSGVLPNFYFHITTAYNLLRHSGVEIGKMDFLGKVQ